MTHLTTKLKELPNVRHGFFTRIYNGREDIDRMAIAKALDIEYTHLITPKQTHSTIVLHIKKPWLRNKAPEADAIVTKVKGLAIGILTADCAPVLFSSKQGDIIGVAHAGWKGAIGGVLEATIDMMEKLGAQKNDIVAALGPCIGLNSYEVKKNFRSPFIVQDRKNKQFFHDAEKAGHLMFDLPAYVCHRLKLAGIETVYNVAQDTCSNESVFFSHRRAILRDAADTEGRQMSAIVLGE